ncbi:MAG TPA: alkaline phosphatase family protein [Blattabacteriaceae bacterium]|nr:alkaline phosphatase family protein [Blattabacteriaceae bacterium]
MKKPILLVAIAVILAGALPLNATGPVSDNSLPHGKTKRVLLISLDGFHRFDLDRYIASHPGSALADLASRSVRYSNAIAMRPSDSFPGSLAMVTGGSPSSTGIFYDVSWDDNLSPAGSDCSTRGAVAPYDEVIDVNPGAEFTTIDPNLLPRDPDHGCVPVFPHSYLKVNTIFEVIKAHGGRTAIADKHPAYDLYNGPSGTGVDDLFTPEAAPFKNSIAQTQADDEVKVQAILHQIDGFDHTGTANVGVPTIFGMNFQNSNIGQKVAGFTDANGDLSAGLAAAYDYVDAALQRMVNELRAQNLLNSTMVIITAKHANSPVDPALRHAIGAGIYPTLIESVRPGLTAQVTTDTIAVIWLTDHSRTADVVATLQANASLIGAEAIYSGTDFDTLFGGSLKSSANRQPDIIVEPKLGVIYTGGSKKVEHGGFHEDDISVPIMISQPGIDAHVVAAPVETKQIAPTILKALGINPRELQAVVLEKTRSLPGLDDDDQ